jgi:hypothetical protein
VLSLSGPIRKDSTGCAPGEIYGYPFSL